MNRLFGLQLILQSDLPNTTKLRYHEWNFQMFVSITACMRYLFLFPGEVADIGNSIALVIDLGSINLA